MYIYIWCGSLFYTHTHGEVDIHIYSIFEYYNLIDMFLYLSTATFVSCYNDTPLPTTDA